jgi:hypothetical protein
LGIVNCQNDTLLTSWSSAAQKSISASNIFSSAFR